ncbi:MAG TPA: GNAT family N-acetyltransferase [Bradyrhizobium sp.]|nr:GNAT family N-acetyltransferase [Bradyrhizobium sp.]
MSTAIPTITTSRLILRPLDLADVDAVQLLFPRWEIVRFMSSHVPWPYPADGALTFIRDMALPAMRQGTEWHWSIRPKLSPEQLIGVISLKDKPDDNRGFWLDSEWQGKGLMTEASLAVTDYWFETLERALLRAPKAVANVPSRRISERSGMRIVKTEDRDYVSGRFREEVWEITRDEWRRRSR